jgi:hypothetical protein
LHEVHNLRLDGHVKRADGLVAHGELEIRSNRPGDPDALTLAA